MRTIGDIRAALLAGQGFPGDEEAFEIDLAHALEVSSETDFTAVAAVIVDYRGRIRLRQDPTFDMALQEGVDLTWQVKVERSR
ncbi:hypothetical protein [Streptomyces sp. enrichment culture]|uniref:hypothetical protein n=1 Tax=Streptomyces sp. enrichment culture TaxID=1795815 RepID=UPI003F544976